MAEIDMEKQKAIIYNIIKNSKTNKTIKYITSLLTGIQITTGINLNDGLPKTIAFLMGISTASIGIQLLNKKTENECNRTFEEEIKKTDQYNECISEYNQFITNLAILIKKLNITNPKEIILFYECLLNQGLLSKKSEVTKLINHEYYNYKYEKNVMEELTGARVASGKTVCRHQSAMLIDLLIELGIKACNISAKTTTISEVKKLIKKRSKKLNHSMVGVIEGDNKYIFDCTVGSFVTSEPNGLAKRYKTEDEICYYLPKEYKNFNKKSLETRMLFEKIRKSEIDEKELCIAEEKIARLMLENYKIICTFYLENEARLNRIAELENELCPHSDEPINEWVLKL
ncbi:MAG: hypothetical protein IJZ46_03890 [Bacilli bacterium]|nr:hypothetical protein [Bacilli bacterium]